MPTVDQNIEGLVRSRAGLWLPLGYYVLTLFGPFVLDDYYMIRRIERFRAGEIAQPRLFRFAESPADRRELRDRTTWPWWLDGRGTTAFFRPLPEVALRLDERLFERHPFGFRLVSLGWFILALLLARRLYRVVGASDLELEAATVAFGAAQTVAAPVAFISARSDLMVVVGVVLASISLWTAMRRDSASPARWDWRIAIFLAIAILGYAFALCCKEAAAPLAVVWFVFAWIEWRRIRGSREDAKVMSWHGPSPAAAHDVITPQGVRAAAGFALTLMLVAAGYVAFYVTRGYGSHIPSRSLSQAFFGALTHAAWTGAMLSPIWTLGIPAVMWIVNDFAIIAWLLVAPAVCVAVVLLRWLRRLWPQSAATRFFCVWTLMFSLPALLATPEPRVLCVATVGWAFLVARLITTTALGPRLRGFLFLTNGTLAIVFGMAGIASGQWAEWSAASAVRRYVATLPRPLRDGDVLVVTVPVRTQELVAAGDRLEILLGQKDVRLYYMTAAGVPNVRRTIEDAHTLLVESDSPRFFGGSIHAGIADATESVQVGRRYETRDFTADIAAMKGPVVTGIRFRFREPLQSDGLFFVPPLTAK